MNTTPAKQTQRNSSSDRIKDEIKGLYSFVRDRLAYHESIGDLPPGELAPEDVADTVLLRAYREFEGRSASQQARHPSEQARGSWLQELATTQLESAIDRLKAARSRGVPLAQDIPETPPAEAVSTLGEEVLDFHHPDEDLKVEDIFPDFDMATPEELVAAKEQLLRCVNTALAGMPIQFRRALRLRYVGGLTGAQLSEVLEEDKVNMERILEYARRELRQSLEAAGCTFIAKAAGRSSGQP